MSPQQVVSRLPMQEEHELESNQSLAQLPLLQGSAAKAAAPKTPTTNPASIHIRAESTFEVVMNPSFVQVAVAPEATPWAVAPRCLLTQLRLPPTVGGDTIQAGVPLSFRLAITGILSRTGITGTFCPSPQRGNDAKEKSRENGQYKQPRNSPSAKHLPNDYSAEDGLP